MDIATTSSVLVRRETKSFTYSPEQLRTLALGTLRRVIDPQGQATFGAEDAAANADGSITCTVAVETVEPEPAPAAASQAESAPTQPTIPTA